MNYSFHPEAEEEFIKAISYYEEQERDLGIDFSIEVYQAIQRVIENPKSWIKVNKELRRILLPRFPYGVLYHLNLEANQIYIVAVMHVRRDPDYWKDRI